VTNLDLREGNLSTSLYNHWYFRSKELLLSLPFFTSSQVQIGRVVDVGAGQCRFTELAKNAVNAQLAYAVDVGYSDEDLKIQDSVRRVKKLEEVPSYEGRSLWMLMDVLEHVDDDSALLNQIVEMSRPGDLFLITVPAFQWLWSSHDEFLGHVKRYSTKDLRQVLTCGDLRVRSIGYFYCFTFIPFVASRLFSRFRKHDVGSDLHESSAILTTILFAILKLEFRLTKGQSFLPGSTIVAVCDQIRK
jgi:hypothetical protein